MKNEFGFYSPARDERVISLLEKNNKEATLKALYIIAESVMKENMELEHYPRPESKLQLAILIRESGDIKRSLDLMLTLLKEWNSTELMLEISNTYKELGEYKKAFEYLKEVPNDFRFTSSLREFLEKMTS
jgi:tetratricopeptide (TPR) repeat protein